MTAGSMTAIAARRAPTRTEFALFVCIPLVLTIIAASIFHGTHLFAVNFHREYWPAGHRVLHGISPYLTDKAHVAAGEAFPYPAAAGVLIAPFALIARNVGEVVWVLACMAAAAGTLRALEVEDWRLYGLVFLWAPVVTAWQTANFSLFLCLGAALMWRWRDRPALAGLAVALLVSIKPFVWPLGLWLIATRRYRATGWAVGLGAIINLVAWSVLGFHQISRYLTDASDVSGHFFRHSYTVVALAMHAGISRPVASAIGVALAALAAGVCILWGRRGEQTRALTMCIALILLASPVQWMHYFVLVLVPFALTRPRLEWLWAASSSNPAGWQVAITLPVIGALLYTAIQSGTDQRLPAGGKPLLRVRRRAAISASLAAGPIA